MNQFRSRRRDDGLVLPIVLVLVVVLGAVVVGLATYASSALRYGQVVEAKNDRLAAADGALREAFERLRIGAGATQCPTDDTTPVVRTFPIDINGAHTTVTCALTGSGLSAINQWALILTANGIGSEKVLSSGQAGGSNQNPKRINGPVYIHDPQLSNMAAQPFDLNAKVTVVDGDVYFPGSTCSADGDRVDVNRYTGGSNNPANLRFEVYPAPRSGICIDAATVTDRSPKAAPNVPDLAGLPAGDVDGDDVAFPGCRVFSPGSYASITLSTGANYFRSGDYRFTGSATITLTKQGNNVPVVTAGYPDATAGLALSIPNPACAAAIAADAPGAGQIAGATFYMSETAHIVVNDGSLEIMPRHQGGFDWVSVQALGGSTLTAGTGATPILTVNGGSGKQSVMQGWVWAPNAWVNYENVTGADAKNQLKGGAALARLHLGANATAAEFAVQVTETPARSFYVLTAESTKRNATTTIVARIEYATNPDRVAVRSWRVMN